MSGWIKVSRNWHDECPWSNDEYSRPEAWLDLLSLANWEDKTWNSSQGPVKVERGSFVTSHERLAERWKWSRYAVIRFLKAAQKAHKIRTASAQNSTTIVILDYEQIVGLNDDTAQEPHTNRTQTAHPSAQEPHTTKNKQITINNNNKTKKEESSRETKLPLAELASAPSACSVDDEWPDFEFVKAFHAPVETKTIDLQCSSPVVQEIDLSPKIKVLPVVDITLSPHIQAWVDYRKEIKKPIKDRTIQAIQKKYLGKSEQLKAAVQHSIASGYQGLFEPPPDKKTSNPFGTAANNQRNLEYIKETRNGHEIEFADLANAFVLDPETPQLGYANGTSLVPSPGGRYRQ